MGAVRFGGRDVREMPKDKEETSVMTGDSEVRAEPRRRREQSRRPSAGPRAADSPSHLSTRCVGDRDCWGSVYPLQTVPSP